MFEDYFGYIVLSFLAVVLAGIFTLIAIFVGPKAPSLVKKTPFESGKDYIPENKTVLVKFYLPAMVFLVFDVEVALLFPYALVMKQLSLTGFFVVLIFLALLALGIVYEFKRSILKIN